MSAKLDRAELLQQGGCIHRRPVFGEPPLLDPMNRNSFDVEVTA
jgi:hypothetical protein